VISGRALRFFRLAISIALVLWLLPAWCLPRGDPNRFAGSTVVADVGQDLDIRFSNPNLANTTIVVLLVDDDGHEIPINIKLDGSGMGRASVPAPDWSYAALEHPTSEDHSIVIL